MTILDTYAQVAGEEVVTQLRQLAAPLKGKRIIHVNSTAVGGGVAEILSKLVPLMRELDLEVTWEVIKGDEDFFQCTKSMHNALQGNPVPISDQHLHHYGDVNADNADQLRDSLQTADYVFIHDPQPAALLSHMPHRQGKWIWRCHIDVSHPYRPVWKFLRHHIAPYDASIFSLAAFAQALPHPEYIIPPSIDPLSEKNLDLQAQEIQQMCDRYGIDTTRPWFIQVSRFDRFKDPVGVIRAYKLATKFLPSLQLVLAGGTADDDPEGAIVLAEVKEAAADDPDIHILALPPDANRTINALQRGADIVMQKSTREGFGLTVTEGMWKGKPVIGGNTGGIRLQVINHHTGFLVNTPEGAALRVRYLLSQPAKLIEMGQKAKEFVRENFLLTRQLREYLTLMVALMYGSEDRIEL
ncbi:Glycosyltransferase type 1 [Halomicronema hongdechloris C2206]|uniref:Glycosyltransferase type 1 n=1 Tax=Halomicronema hongdechloris C2206 TaxID=1641165 RepID=A0A1Z3HQR5_9CYAN|nr:glycosyltransferase [Halomicronema hongdechloris]ASC72664.1 Glycosyltransferase type 1 [Halomicronema hongdechloris C2206]